MKLIRFLFKRRTVVKPIAPYEGDPNGGGFGWVVMQINTIEDFIDDYRRAGLRIAIDNLVALWRLE